MTHARHLLQADRLSEDDWQTLIVDLARLLRLRVFHSGDSRRDLCAGFPDLVILGPKGGGAFELKTTAGKVDPEQTAWLTAFRALGIPAEVWRPREWWHVQRCLYVMAGKPIPGVLRVPEDDDEAVRRSCG